MTLDLRLLNCVDSTGSAAPQGNDDLDAILAEVGALPSTTADAPASGAPGPSPAEAPVDSLMAVEDVQAAIDAHGVSKTRMQKLKQRLKKLQVLALVIPPPARST
jgi:hypothetical protein